MAGESELILNYRCNRGGRVQVELLGNPESRDPVRAVLLEGDFLGGVVVWPGGNELCADPKDDCVVRLHLDRAEVYAYDVRPKMPRSGE